LTLIAFSSSFSVKAEIPKFRRVSGLTSFLSSLAKEYSLVSIPASLRTLIKEEAKRFFQKLIFS